MEDQSFNNDFEISRSNIIKCEEEDRVSKIDEINQYFYDLFDEDQFSKVHIYPTVNELLRDKFPIDFAIPTDGKFKNTKDYLMKMYELQRENFLGPIKQLIQYVNDQNPSSIEDFLNHLKTYQEEKKNHVFEIYEVNVMNREICQAGFVVTLEVQQNKQLQFLSDLKEFQQFKTKNLVLLVNESTGSIIFGTVHNQYSQEYENDDNDGDEDVGDNKGQQNIENQENRTYTSNPQVNQKKSAEHKIKILTNSNNYTDIIQQFDSKNKFVLLETSEFWLPVYYNLKVLYYMMQSSNDIAFHNQILRGEYPIQNEPQYELLAKKQKIYQKKLQKIQQKVNSRKDLDVSQITALNDILTKSLHYVEGPPGTGKSFVAVQATLNKLRIYSELQEDISERKPIFILCKKNASLDSFLTSVIQSNEQSVLRMGRPSDRFIKNYSLQLKLSSMNIPWEEEKESKNFNKKLYSKPDSNLEESKIIQYFKKSGIDLLQIFSDLFIEQFIPQSEFSNRKLLEFQKLLFNSWVNNKMDYNEIHDFIINNQEKITKQLELLLPNHIKTLSQQIIKKIDVEKDLIDYDFEDLESDQSEQINFRIRNEKLPNRNKGQRFLRSLPIIKKFTDLNGTIRQKIIEYAYWYQKIDMIDEMYKYYQTSLKKLKNKNLLKYDRQNIDIIRSQNIIGMTTTGFTKWFKYIEVIKPEIIIVEEASEIEEWNMACLLQPYVKHLIQIGDFRQLAPIQRNHKFINKYNIKTSQFQRVIDKLEMKLSTKLIFQRRMIPELSAFPRIVYSENFYKDHQEDVGKLITESNIQLKNKIQFIDHTFPEQTSSSSYINIFEAQLAVYYAYMLNKFYNIPKSHITILCMYKSQVNYIIDYASKFDQEYKVFQYEGENNNSRQFVETVDEYQGKENQYIILSCVRSNKQRNLGFVQEENRINVAFSRAKLGLIVLGAFWMLEKISLWDKFINQAIETKAFFQNINELPQEVQQDFYHKHFNDFKGKCQINPHHIAHIGRCNTYDENQELQVDEEGEEENQKFVIEVNNEDDNLQQELEQEEFKENIQSKGSTHHDYSLLNEGEENKHQDIIVSKENNQNKVNNQKTGREKRPSYQNKTEKQTVEQSKATPSESNSIEQNENKSTTVQRRKYIRRLKNNLEEIDEREEDERAFIHEEPIKSKGEQLLNLDSQIREQKQEQIIEIQHQSYCSEENKYNSDNNSRNLGDLTHFGATNKTNKNSIEQSNQIGRNKRSNPQKNIQQGNIEIEISKNESDDFDKDKLRNSNQKLIINPKANEEYIMLKEQDQTKQQSVLTQNHQNIKSDSNKLIQNNNDYKYSNQSQKYKDVFVRKSDIQNEIENNNSNNNNNCKEISQYLDSDKDANLCRSINNQNATQNAIYIKKSDFLIENQMKEEANKKIQRNNQLNSSKLVYDNNQINNSFSQSFELSSNYQKHQKGEYIRKSEIKDDNLKKEKYYNEASLSQPIQQSSQFIPLRSLVENLLIPQNNQNQKNGQGINDSINNQSIQNKSIQYKQLNETNVSNFSKNFKQKVNQSNKFETLSEDSYSSSLNQSILSFTSEQYDHNDSKLKSLTSINKSKIKGKTQNKSSSRTIYEPKQIQKKPV